MGSKQKKKITAKVKVSPDQRQDRSRILTKERQRQRRARLLGRSVDEKNIEKKKSSSLSSKSQESLHETTEEISEEVDIKEECNSDEENTQEEEPESELLPGPKGQKLYYDGKGYYYTQLYEDVTYRWLQCSHGECRVMAQMKQYDKAPIRLVDPGSEHSHPANPARRDRILFLHTVKTRHANESTPFNVIFQQEAHKNPVGASFFSFDKIQAHLQKKISLGGSDNLSQESVLSAASKLSMIARPNIEMEPVAKKRRLEKDLPLPENRSQKLELLKSLKDVSVTECESSESSDLSLSQPSERIPGPYPHTYLYHDGQGHFYKPLSITGSTRYLICNTTGCHARAVMAVDDNAPITLEANSPAHNHSLGPSQKTVSSSPSIRPVDISKMLCQEKENRLDKMETPMVVLNKYPVMEHRAKRFEKIEGPEYYYDFRGHYYFSTRIEKDKRLLRCLNPTCLAQAMMDVDGATEIQPMSGTPPHNHKPDLSLKYHSKIREWEDQWSESLPSERLPSFRVQYCCYHDGRGYYYHQTTQKDNIRCLACVEPKCPVKAFMSTLKDAPITVSGLRMGHAHGPDHTLRDALLFIDAVRVRVRADTPPASAIALEATRNPVGAERVDFLSLKLCLEQAIKLAKGKSKEGITEDEVDFSTCLKSRKTVTWMKPSTDHQVPVPNHFTSPNPKINDIDEDDYDKSKNPKEQCKPNSHTAQTKSELVPALLSDTWLYHDGSGYYYNYSIKSGYRYLHCVLPKCRGQAVAAQAGGPVKLQRPHSHGPQPPQHRLELWFFHKVKRRAQRSPDTPIKLIYKEVAQRDPDGAALVSQEEVVELMEKYLFSIIKSGSSVNDLTNKTSVPVSVPVDAEILPNTGGECQYYDGQGYYYTIDHTVKRGATKFLKCSYLASCSARVALEDGKLKKINGHPGPRHNHPPDFLHRDICLFTQALKKRARDQESPVSAIYEEEAKKHPKAAAVLKEDQIKEKLISIRKFVKNEVSLQAEEEEEPDGSGSSSDQAKPFVASEVFPGKTKFVYHDGRGYYYHQTFTTNQMRYLMCCEPHCLAQARMGLMGGSPVVAQVGAPRHCHGPDPLRRRLLLLVGRVRHQAKQRTNKPDVIYRQETARDPIIAAQIPKDYIFNLIVNAQKPENKGTGSSVEDQEPNEDENLWTFSEVGERLPSEHGWLYHNGRGFYYYSHDVDKSKSRRILRCCEEGCEATARLEGDLRVSRAPGSVLHNHLPDPQRLASLQLLHRVATRAQLEHASVADIYEEEARRDPDAAARLRKNKLNKILKSLTVRKYFKELEEEDLGLEEETSEEFLRGEGVRVKPCEMLPSPVSSEPVYHDVEGHYYGKLRKTTDRLYVKCLMPVCHARGYIQSNEPWRLYVPLLWDTHNHTPDPHYRDKLLFINNVRKRVLNEDTPVDTIYREESEKEPEFFLYGADQANEIAIKNLMHKLRKSKCVEDDIDTFPFEEFSEDSTRPSTEGSLQRVSQPAPQPQNVTGPVLMFTGRPVNETVEPRVYPPASKSPVAPQAEPRPVSVKDERMESADEGDDEYTEEEYLEEERLEEGPRFLRSSKCSKTSKSPPLKKRSSKPPESPPPTLKVEIDLNMNNSTRTWMETDSDVLPVLPSEKLPSHTFRSIYHNGRGYYFQVDTVRENNMYMSCIEPMCGVRGIKLADQDDSPIVPSTNMDHNHKPDYNRRRHLLFIKHCKERAAAETNLSINTIWAQEAARDPESASQFNAQKIRTQMNKYRHEQAANLDSSFKQSKPPKGLKDYREHKSLLKVKLQSSPVQPIAPKPEQPSVKPEPPVVKMKLQSSPVQPAEPPAAKPEPPADIHQDTVPERIPSLVGDTLWHANGYFYSTISTSESFEKAKCVEKACVAWAQVTLGDRGQPLAIKQCQPGGHCHPPDLNRRDQMLFIERCKRRAATTLQSVEEIYYDEAAKAPEVAAQLSAVRVKRAMGIAKKERMKKGGRLDYDSPGSGDYGMAELGEMAKVQVSVGAGADEGEVELDQGDYCPDDAADEDDVWAVDPHSLTPEQRLERKKSLARERQRRRRYKMATDPNKWEQLERERQRTRERASAWQRQKQMEKREARLRARGQTDDDSDWEPKMKPLLGPKFLKELAKTASEEEYEDEEEVVDESYSDYVTLEDDMDSCETMLYEDQAEDNIQTESQEEGACNLEDEETKKILRSHMVHGRRINSFNYHDGKGFFYETLKISNNQRYLRCVVGGCNAVGVMPLGWDDAPITPTPKSPAHSHPPDSRHEGLVRFVQRCETRASEEETFLQIILNEEAKADPVSASKLVMKKLLQRMIKIREDSLEPGTDSEPELNLSAVEDNNSEKEENAVSENCEETNHPPAEEEVRRKGEKKSEILPGHRPDTSIYHDMNGYYFIFNALKGNKRYLRCIETSCRVRGTMELYDGAPILSPHCSEHNHLPDFQRKKFVLFLRACNDRAVSEDLPIAQIYQEECDKDPVSATMISTQNLLQRMSRARKQTSRHCPDEDQNELAEACTSNTITTDIPPHELVEGRDKENSQAEGGTEIVVEDSAPTEECQEGRPVPEDQLQPSETLPGPVRPNSTMYHDGRGYYYIYNNQTENVWYLKCAEPQCRVRGHMQPGEGNPIVQSPGTVHNHPPDYRRRQFVLWMTQAKLRAVTEDLPIPTILAQEAARDPQSASMIPQANMRTRLYRARKSDVKKASSEVDDFDMEDQTSKPVLLVFKKVDTAGDGENESEDQDTVEGSEKVVEDSTPTEECQEGGPVPEDQLQPSETLPGPVRPNSTMYHDGRGYYYIYNNQTENFWYLKCAEPQCRVRGHMQPGEGNPIVQSPGTVHNHPPDYRRRQFVLWMTQAKLRAVTEDLPIPTILAQEAARDPQSASMIPLENMRTRLYRARKSVVKKASSELDDFNSEDQTSKPGLLVVKKVDTAGDGENESEDQDTVAMVANLAQDQDSEAVFTIQAEGSQDSNTVYLYQPSECSQQPDTYVDDKGFCYQQTSVRNGIRYLKCVEVGCKARANMGLDEDAAITLSKQGSHHNHTAHTPQQLAMLMDPDSASIQVMYTDEDGGQQVALCHIAEEEGRSKRPYRQRHKPELTIDPEEPPVDVSALCEVDYAVGEDTPEADYSHDGDQQKYPLKPSEVIPGLRPDANNYHDGNGFYYELNRLSPNIRYLKCLTKNCKARAYMELGKENAPIIVTKSARHNHGPDPSRKQFTVFLHRVTRRAAEEDTPINVIYQQEAERDPQSARQIKMENVKQRMMRFRKKHCQGKIMNQEPTASSEVDTDGSMYHFFIKDKEQQEEAEEEKEGGTEKREGEGERVLYESYVVSEVEVESQQ